MLRADAKSPRPLARASMLAVVAERKVKRSQIMSLAAIDGLSAARSTVEPKRPTTRASVASSRGASMAEPSAGTTKRRTAPRLSANVRGGASSVAVPAPELLGMRRQAAARALLAKDPHGAPRRLRPTTARTAAPAVPKSAMPATARKKRCGLRLPPSLAAEMPLCCSGGGGGVVLPPRGTLQPSSARLCRARSSSCGGTMP
mmetsp:Transcript_15450/g.42596  ORF Transcript_15450/g.42596 Transcript_15450/m.42596 type:complete len:202 (+) Transcript_15450:1191-1796(+)